MRRPRRVGRLRRAVVSTAAIAAVLGFADRGRAANSYWDGDGQGVVGGGSGAWDNTLARWSATPGGATYSNFNSADDAIFGGTAAGGVVNVAAPISANSISLAAGPYLFSGAGPITLTSGVVDTGAQGAHFAQPISGTNGLTKNGAGVLLFDAGNSYAGATTINAGTLAPGHSAASLPDASAVLVSAGATLALGYTGGFLGDTIGSLAGGGDVTFAPATFAGYGEITGSSLVVGGDGSSTTFAGNLLGAGGSIQKDGGGTLRLSGNNTIAGGMRVTGGGVSVASAAAIAPTCPVILTGSATLDLLAPAALGALGSLSGGQTVNTNGNALTVGASGMNFQSNAVITGATGQLIKVGGGVQQLTTVGSPSTYGGGTSVRDGILIVSGDAKLGALSGTVSLDGGTLGNFASAAGGAVGLSSARAFTLNAPAAPGGGGFQVLHSSAVTLLTSITIGTAGASTGKVSGTGGLTKTGPGALILNNAADDFSGGMLVLSGVVESLANAANATPFGSGSIDLEGGRLFVHPANGNSGSNITVRAASAPGATLTYAAGSEIRVDRTTSGATWNLVKLDVGPAGAASDTVLHRAPGGTLLLIPRTLTALGTSSSAEDVIVEGGVSMRNGIVSPSILATATGSTNPDFLTYGANGFAKVVYASSDINTATNTSVTSVTVNQTLTADRTAYALKTAGIIDGPFNLSIGDGSGPATLVMALGSAIQTSGLRFDGTDAVIYAQRTSGTGVQAPLAISGALSITGAGGLTKIGTGFVQLNAPASYSGATRIGQGGIQAGVDDALPTATDLLFTGSVPETVTNFTLEQATLKLAGSVRQTVHSLASENAFAQVDLTAGTLTVNQGTNTTFRGTFLGSGGSGTLVKSGAGTLALNPYVGGSFADNGSAPFVPTYGKLKITGGTVAVSSFNSLPANPATLVADAITLDTGGTLRFDFAPIFTAVIDNASAVMSFSTQSPGVAIAPNRGLTLGPGGGGTISVTDPRALIVWQRGNGETIGTDDYAIVNGPGDLIKDGPGTLRLGIGNLNTGRVVIKGGTLQFQNDSALGDYSSGGLRADGLTLDGGVAQSNGSGVLGANRGITVTANGGAIKGTFAVNAAVSGAGTLHVIRVDRAAASAVTLNAASPNFSGTLHLTDGVTNFAVSGAAGTGTIAVEPLFPVTIAKTSGLADTVLDNPITLGGGSTITVRADAGVGSLVLNGTISGGNDLCKSGAGTVLIGGSASDYTGRTIVSAGTLAVAASGALGSAAGETVVLPGATLAFGGNVNYAAGEALTLIGGTLRNSSGANTFAGEVIVAADASADVASGSLKLTAGAHGASTLSKSGGGTLELKNVRAGGLSVAAGKVAMTADPSAAGVSVARTLSVAAGAQLDLAANKLVTATAIATVNGLIASGRNGGGWTGSGIVTSQSSATSGNFTSLGVASAQQVKGIAPGATAVWAGQTVTGSDTLVMYTYGGDANLDGKINVDDYGRIDFNVNLGTSGWFNGDFNYDGKINVDDYGIIDFNVGIQGAPFFTAGGAASDFGEVRRGAERSAVPEPLMPLPLILTAALLKRRRRR